MYHIYDPTHKGWVTELDRDTDQYNIACDVAQALTFSFEDAVHVANILFLVHDRPFEVRIHAS